MMYLLLLYPLLIKLLIVLLIHLLTINALIFNFSNHSANPPSGGAALIYTTMKHPIIFTNRDVLGDLLCVRCEFTEKYTDIYIYNCFFYINNVYKTQFVAKVENYSELQDLCYDYMLNF